MIQVLSGGKEMGGSAGIATNVKRKRITMSQLSLIALYGEKTIILKEMINECQKIITNILGINYYPYDLRQIHATIISLERLDKTKLNKNFNKYQNQQKIMDFKGLLYFLRNNGGIKFQVQIGGFNQFAHPFLSRKNNPYKRSFQIIQDKFVLIGWPTQKKKSKNDFDGLIDSAQTYPKTLDNIRRTFQKYNILHRYHCKPMDIDNDFYFRIGMMEPNSINLINHNQIEDDVRSYLSSIKPIYQDIDANNIFLACYEDEKLPVDTTRTWSIFDKIIDQEFLWSLYN